MATITKEELIECAKIVRQKCHDFAFSKASQWESFHKRASLEGMCALASACLQLYLKRKGITSHLVKSETHCWIECGDYFIDLTSSQFYVYSEKNPFFIVRKEELIEFVGKKHAYQDWKRADDFFEYSNWRKGQCPNIKKIRQILRQGQLVFPINCTFCYTRN